MALAPEDKFALYVEVEGCERPILSINLSLKGLFDDVVIPYQGGEPFFIDGVPLTKEKIKRLKIVKVGKDFQHALSSFKTGLTRSEAPTRKIYGDQYHTRMEYIFLNNGEDITSQIIKAYDTSIKPSLKDYIPNKEKILDAATQTLIAGLKFIG